eukprot:Tamp_13142.p2 GENE.Tamp_13142~~Tamp_13142.p2  ORF type:complete len:198 (+),score=21.35 Tamp_13142:576-1169(+)
MLARGLGSCWCLLHYACLVAQISRGGDLLARALRPLGVSHSASCGILTLIFHILVFGAFGQRRAGWFAESVNNLMTVSFLVAMVSVMSLGLGEAKVERLVRADWRPSTFIDMAPLMLQIMMYIQTVPTVCGRLKGNKARVKIAVFFGSLCPLLVCLIWSAVGIAMVPPEIGIVICGLMRVLCMCALTHVCYLCVALV